MIVKTTRYNQNKCLDCVYCSIINKLSNNNYNIQCKCFNKEFQSKYFTCKEYESLRQDTETKYVSRKAKYELSKEDKLIGEQLSIYGE